MTTRPRFLFATYDFANSGYVLIFQSFLFPVFLSSIATNSGVGRSNSVWTLVVTLSSLIAIGSGPFVGRMADKLGKAVVFGTVVVATGLLAMVTPAIPSLVLVAMSFVFFNALFELSQSLYDSFLLNIEKSKDGITSLSSFAWGFGYVGGALFAALYFGLDRMGLSSNLQLSIIALSFLVCSVPSVVGFRRLAPVAPSPIRLEGLRDILRVSSPVPWTHIGIYWIIADAVAGVMYFAPLYIQQDLGLNLRTTGALMLGGQLIAFPLTILVGRLAVRIGVVRTIQLCLFVWTLSLVALFRANSLYDLLPVMAGLSLVMGSTQALLRAHFAFRVNTASSAEGFGYYAVAQKSSTVVTPLLVGAVTLAQGSFRSAFLLLALLMVLAFLLAFRLNPRPGQVTPR